MVANTQKNTRKRTSPRVIEDQICVDSLGIGSIPETRWPRCFFDNPEFILDLFSLRSIWDRRMRVRFLAQAGGEQYQIP